MSKRVKDVKSLINKLSDSTAFKNKVDETIQKKKISKFLFALRCDHGFTQEKMAEKMICSQSRISKIESSYDEELSVKDLLDYGKSLNLQLELGYRSPSVKIVDLIKHHVFKIKYYLETLVNLAQDDETIDEGVKKFHFEALFNVVKITLGSLSTLKSFKKEKQTVGKKVIHLSVPLELKKTSSMQKV